MPKFSGPRLPSGKYYSKRKAGRPKGSKNRKKKAPAKVTVAKMRQVAKKTVMSLAETKYFNTSRLTTLTRLATISSRSLATAINVKAFAVGTGDNPAQGNTGTIDYGFVAGQGNPDVIPLNMCRVFGNTNPDSSLRKNAVEGAYVQPSICRSEWIIEFPQLFTQADSSVYTEANPLYMRMVRVVPRMRKYSDVDIDPKGDLFVDQYGEAIGVNSGNFNQLELQLLKVNSRKYQVVQDYQHMFVPSSTGSTFAIADSNTQITNLSRYGSRLKLVCNHKQPTKLFYTQTLDGTIVDAAQPEAGQSNELIFFHFTTIGNGGDTDTDCDIEITCKAVSTFKDF